MTNFEKLKANGLANDNFTSDEQAEVNDLSESTVNKIVACANPEGLDGAAGDQIA